MSGVWVVEIFVIARFCDVDGVFGETVYHCSVNCTETYVSRISLSKESVQRLPRRALEGKIPPFNHFFPHLLATISPCFLIAHVDLYSRYWHEVFVPVVVIQRSTLYF